ncbi:MAG: putative transcriptional regulatory protein AraC family [Tardiphaga sp.]|nr:putative transcriptional regulatory protein AraC family [Tardiphaga sp.]
MSFIKDTFKDNSARIVEFSTESLPEQDRIAYWREHYGHIMLRVDLEPARDATFEACMTSLALPGLQIIEASSTPAKISRTGAYLADGNDDAVLAINRRGSVIVSSGGREQNLQENEAILLTGNEPTSFHRTSMGQSFTLRVPRAMLASTIVDTDDAVMRVIPQQRGALRLLTEYTHLLFESGITLDSQLLNLSVTHIHDLLALTIGPATDFAETARTRGLRAARLKLAKSYIIEHSHRRDLTVGSVAAHLSVTPRYVQRMFEADGSTFSEFLVGQRLARAHRLLCEPNSLHTAISTIAYDAGFGDLSYFNRRFRRLYGLTPRDVRGDTR